MQDTWATLARDFERDLAGGIVLALIAHFILF
jgi:hypothetical protein